MQQELLLGQYFPTDSWLHKLDPRSKLVGIFMLMAAFLIVDDLTSLTVLLIITILISRTSGIPALAFLKSLRPLLWLLLITLAFPLFLTTGKPIVQWGMLVITQEGFIQGGFNTIRLVVILIVTSLLTLTTSPLELSKGLEGLFKPLRPLGLPVQELALMMSLTMRFIPMLLEEADKLIAAQKARGANFGLGNIFKRTQAYLAILIPLFLSAFRRVDQLAVAMETRCYRGAANRTKMHPLEWKTKDTIAVVFCALVPVVLLLQ